MNWKYKVINKIAKLLGIKIYFKDPIHNFHPLSALEIIQKNNLIKHAINVELTQSEQQYVDHYPQYKKHVVIKNICTEIGRGLNMLADGYFDELFKEEGYNNKTERYRFEFYTKNRYE